MNREDIIYPGETIKELLEVNNLTQNDLAQKLKVDLKTINEIINGKGVITTDTAIKLGLIFNISPSFWNNLEFNYRLELREFEENKKIKEDYNKIKTVYDEILKREWIKQAENNVEKIKNIKSYLKITDFEHIDDEFDKIACRRSESKHFSKLSFLIWVQYGINIANQKTIKAFNKEGITNAIPKIRELTMYEDQEEAREQLKIICEENGIILVYASNLKNTSVQGIAKWITSDKALIMVSDRRKRVATFWYTFMHELGHLLKGSKKVFYVDNDDYKDEEEEKADLFAKNSLIPRNEYSKFIVNNITEESILEFSERICVSPDIVAGRISFDLTVYNQKILKKFDRFLEFKT